MIDHIRSSLCVHFVLVYNTWLKTSNSPSYFECLWNTEGVFTTFLKFDNIMYFDMTDMISFDMTDMISFDMIDMISFDITDMISFDMTNKISFDMTDMISFDMTEMISFDD